MGRSRFLGGTNIEKNARDLRVYMAGESGVPYQVMVSDDDTTPGYLSAKITSTDGSVVITVANDGADEDLDLSVAVYVAAEIATHAALPNAHHNQSHVLATASGLGADHTVSGLTAGHVLRATGATTAAFGALQATDLAVHVLATTSGLGSQHSVSGLTARQVLIATGSTTALFRALEDADIPASIARDSEVTAAVSAHTADADAHHNWPLLDADIPSTIARDSEVTAAISSHASDANAHHNRSHAITSASDHTVTGAALDVVGLTATNALGILTPSAAVSAAVSALLKTDSNGRLRVQGLGIGTAAAGNALYVNADINFSGDRSLISGSAAITISGTSTIVDADVNQLRIRRYDATRYRLNIAPGASGVTVSAYDDTGAVYHPLVINASSHTLSGGNVTVSNSLTVGGDLTISTNGNQADRFMMENSSVSGSSVFYDFNQTDRDAGSTGAFELGFYRDANNITQVRMSKEVFEVIIRSGGTYRFPLEVRAQQVILAELPTSNPGIIGALYRSGNDVLIST